MRSEESIKKEVAELDKMASERASQVVMADCKYIAIVNRKKALEDVLSGEGETGDGKQEAPNPPAGEGQE